MRIAPRENLRRAGRRRISASFSLGVDVGRWRLLAYFRALRFQLQPRACESRARLEIISPWPRRRGQHKQQLLMTTPTPIDARALARSAAEALHRGDARKARESFERILAAGLGDADTCLGLAQACRAL